MNMKSKLRTLLLLVLSLAEGLSLCLLGGGCQHQPVRENYPAFIKNAGKDGEKLPMMLSIDRVLLEDIVPAFAHVLKFTYDFEPSRKYKLVTLEVPETTMTRKEIWDLFAKLLRNCNAVYKVEGTKVIISPDENAVVEEPDEKAPLDDKEHVKHSKKTPEELKQIREEILKKMREKNIKQPIGTLDE